MSHSLPLPPVPAQLEFLSLLFPLPHSHLESQEDTLQAAAALTQRLQWLPL